MSADDGLKAALDYIAGIRDDDQRAYGERYLRWLRFGHTPELPDRGNVSRLAAVQVRTEIRERLRGGGWR